MSKRTARGISDFQRKTNKMLKGTRLTNHTDCRAEPHMFGLHWIDLALLANLTLLRFRRSGDVARTD
jgi:hypothetical protein